MLQSQFCVHCVQSIMGEISFTDRLTNLFNSGEGKKAVPGFLNFSVLETSTFANFENDSTETLFYTTTTPTTMEDENSSVSAYLNTTQDLYNDSSELPSRFNDTDTLIFGIIPNRNIFSQILYSFMLFLISSIGISTNLGVFFVICKEPALQIKKQLSSIPIWNLATANIVTLLYVCFPAGIAVAYDGFPFSFMICQIQSGIAWTTFVVVLFTMGTISVERYVATKWPYKYAEWITKPRLLSACVISWIAGLMSGIFVAVNDKWVYFDYWIGICDFTWSNIENFYTWFTVVFVTLLALPLCLNIVTAYLVKTNNYSGVRPTSKAPPRPRFLMSPEFDYFMKQKTFTPDLGAKQQKPSFLGQFKTIMRPNPLVEARSSIQTLQLRDELFTKVEEQATRMGAGISEELDEGAGDIQNTETEMNPKMLLKSMLIVQLCFVIMMSPCVFVRLAKIIFKYDNTHWVSNVSILLYFATSIVNPIVYALTRKDFREAYVRLGEGILKFGKSEGATSNESQVS